MKLNTFVTFLILFFTAFQSCIPLNNVHSIDTYELIEGKLKARKESKRYTKFKVSNHSSVTMALKYLESKFDVFKYKNTAYTSKKLFWDKDVNFNLEFEFTSDIQVYLDLMELLDKDRENNGFPEEEDNGYDKEHNFISISIKDDTGTDYLAQNSELRNRLISYLKSLNNEYKSYAKSINFLNQ